MTVFLVERYLPGWTSDEIVRLVNTIRSRRADLDARCIHHLGSIVLPGEETCLCVFDAVDAGQVREANERLGLPVDRVVVGELIATERRPPPSRTVSESVRDNDAPTRRVALPRSMISGDGSPTEVP